MDNPYRPGAGHMPPYLAGRVQETEEFRRLLGQKVIMENLILTGLRGVGKTVLLETFRPIARETDWLWVGTDLSESASLSEERAATRLLTDLSVITSSLTTGQEKQLLIGFAGGTLTTDRRLNYEALRRIYDETPGLVSDKLKQVLEIVWAYLGAMGSHGIVFAYDEAQNLGDHEARQEFPLSLLLDVFQSIQRKGIPFLLALAGLPTLGPKLVLARTFSERMFHVVTLDRLSDSESREAILRPLKQAQCEVLLNKTSVETIIRISGGYPYFIQFICKEIYDLFIERLNSAQPAVVPVDEIVRKLDADFFAGRWARATDRQRDLLWVAANLETAGEEFTVREIVAASKTGLKRAFSSSHVGQMLTALTSASLVYKDRHGKYSFAVPLMDQFIRRQEPPEGAAVA